TRVGGIPEVLQEGTSGYLVNSGDAEELARRVSHLIDHPELAREMGRAGRETVVQRFAFRERTRRLERLYDRVVNSRRPTRGSSRSRTSSRIPPRVGPFRGTSTSSPSSLPSTGSICSRSINGP